MESFTQLFGELVAFVYSCFDCIVIHGYLANLPTSSPTCSDRSSAFQ